MTTRFTLGDPDRGEPSVSTDVVRFAPTARRALGVDVGDPVTVEAGASTVAVVGDDAPQLPDDVVLAGDTVRRNAESTVGAAVTVAPAEPTPARSVIVAPTRSISLSGDTDALSRALAGRPISAGDRVTVGLFGGSLDVRLTVVDLDPSGPVVVTDETTVSVRPAAGDSVEGGVPAPPPGGIGGLAEARSALRRLVVRPLSDPERYAAVGARTPAGVLVAGPSGVGKTGLLRAVATDAGLPIHEASPTDCESRESLATVLRAAANDTPGIVLIEGLDAVAPPPGREGGRSDHAAVGWLLDRVRERDDLVVVGEAPSADAVDPALRRGGRFDAEIQVGLPDRAARREVLSVHAADLRLADDADLDGLAARTHGYTGADLEAVLVEATTRAVDRAAGDGAPTVGRADLDAAVDAVGPAALRERAIERPSVSYAEIGGLDDAIEAVVRAVEWPLRYPDLFERLAIDPPTGVLLSGPPGTGKTLLAKAVATATAANFLSVDGPELMNRYVGESERGVRELFDRARSSAPAVVFLDEVDALAPARGSTDTGAAERVVSQLLTELDGLSARGEVAVLAATNRPDAIDPALLRPGRIEKRVPVPLPDRAARREILAIHLANVPTAGVDRDALAAATAGYTGSDLAGVVREAGLRAMGEALDASPSAANPDEPVVEHRHLQAAVDASQPSVGGSAADFEWQDP